MRWWKRRREAEERTVDLGERLAPYELPPRPAPGEGWDLPADPLAPPDPPGRPDQRAAS
jgi:hypothetical protein